MVQLADKLKKKHPETSNATKWLNAGNYRANFLKFNGPHETNFGKSILIQQGLRNRECLLFVAVLWAEVQVCALQTSRQYYHTTQHCKSVFSDSASVPESNNSEISVILLSQNQRIARFVAPRWARFCCNEIPRIWSFCGSHIIWLTLHVDFRFKVFMNGTGLYAPSMALEAGQYCRAGSSQHQDLLVFANAFASRSACTRLLLRASAPLWSTSSVCSFQTNLNCMQFQWRVSPSGFPLLCVEWWPQPTRPL